MIVTARQIPEGDEAAWHRSWKQTVEQLHPRTRRRCLPAVSPAPVWLLGGYDAEAGA